MPKPFLLILYYNSITILSVSLFIILTMKFLKDADKNYDTHVLTKILMVLMFFLFIDGLYNILLIASEYGLLNVNYYLLLISPEAQLIPKSGIFLSTVLIVYFVFDHKIEQFKSREEGFQELEDLNSELEERAHELEQSQETLQQKVKEMERFNEIAKSREHKMMELVKKIEVLEKKLKR